MKLGNYLVKSTIFELRYLPNFEVDTKMLSTLNEMREDFTRFDISEVMRQKAYTLTNEEGYIRLGWEWNRFYLLLQNGDSIEDVKNKLNKYISLYDNKYGINLFSRIGTRVIFLYPSDKSMDEISNEFKGKIYKNKNIFDDIGNIRDIGFAGFTLEDENYNINLSFGPMTYKEVKMKIAEFDYEDNYKSAIIVDIDLYQENIKIKAKSYFENALEAARIKSIKIKQELENE